MGSVKVEVKGDEEILALLDRLPKLVVSAGGPLDKATSKASAIVARRARQIVPNSKTNSKGDSRKKQSKKSRNIWTKKLKDTIRSKVIRYETGAWAVVGPKNPEGNMAHFMQEKPRVLVLWGKKSAVQKYRLDRNWIVQAFEETKDQQLSAAKDVLKAEIDSHMRS